MNASFHAAAIIAKLAARRDARRDAMRRRPEALTPSQRVEELLKRRNANRRRRLAYTADERAREQEAIRSRNVKRRADGTYKRGEAAKSARGQRRGCVRHVVDPALHHHVGPTCLEGAEAEAMDKDCRLSSLSAADADDMYARCRRSLGFYGKGGELVWLACQQLTLVRRCKVMLLRQLPL